MIPYNTPHNVPYNNTGPATVKIFDPTPTISPSLFVSRAGETTALANPVTGTKVPAPATRAILSKIPTPVRTADRKIRKRVVVKEASAFSIPKNVNNCIHISPIAQMLPPTANAARQSLCVCERAERLSVKVLYACFSIRFFPFSFHAVPVFAFFPLVFLWFLFSFSLVCAEKQDRSPIFSFDKCKFSMNI